MSSILKSISIVSVGLLIGYFGALSIKDHSLKANQNNRYLASVHMTKLATVQNAQTHFEIQVKNESVAISNDETSIVKVIITPYFDTEADLNYSWITPENIQVISGSVAGHISRLEKDKSIELSLDITGYSKETRNYISFEITGKINSIPIKQDVLLTSRPEDSFEYLVQQNAMTEDKKKNSANRSNTTSESKKRFDPKNIIR